MTKAKKPAKSRMQNTEKEKFEEICELIRSVDSNGDAIRQTLKLRTISEKIRVILQDEKIVRCVVYFKRFISIQ